MSSNAIKKNDALAAARKSMYRAFLLDTAEKVFAQHGFEGTKMQEVAQEASVSLSTLYSTFGNKAAIHQAVHTQRLKELFDEVARNGMLSAGQPLLIRMLAGTATWIRFHMKHPDYLRMHLREGHAWTNLDSLRSADERAAWRRGFDWNVRVTQQLMDEGWLRQDDPALVTRMSVAMQQARLAVWVERDMPDNAEDVVRYLLRLFLNTFAADDRRDEVFEVGLAGFYEFERTLKGDPLQPSTREIHDA